jgi:hypothetical protein
MKSNQIKEIFKKWHSEKYNNISDDDIEENDVDGAIAFTVNEVDYCVENVIL